jgi:hypothetical protein
MGVFIGVLALAYSGISLANLGLLETLLVAAALVAAVFLVLTRETDEGRTAGLGVGAFAAVLLVAFASAGNMLTILVGVISALALVVIGLRASRDVVVVTLTFLAFLTGLQAITDAWVLLKIVSMPEALMPFNDASSMARDVGGPAALWAFVWIALDVAIFGASVYLTFVRPARRA